eukprot:381045-Amphidinium_carterae.1
MISIFLHRHVAQHQGLVAASSACNDVAVIVMNCLHALWQIAVECCSRVPSHPCHAWRALSRIPGRMGH